MKSLVWTGSSVDDVRAFPRDARQYGLDPSDWKPMVAIGAGVREIRIHTKVEHRVIYIAKFAEAVYVLHAFEKRTGRTRAADIELARRRFATVLVDRRAR